MYESVNTADIDESTEINKASYNTCVVLAFLDVVPDLSTLLAALFGNDDSVASGDSKTTLLSVELSNENLKSLTYIRLQILNIACLDLSSVNVDINTLIRTRLLFLLRSHALLRTALSVLTRALISISTEHRSRPAK